MKIMNSFFFLQLIIYCCLIRISNAAKNKNIWTDNSFKCDSKIFLYGNRPTFWKAFLR